MKYLDETAPVNEEFFKEFIQVLKDWVLINKCWCKGGKCLYCRTKVLLEKLEK